MEEYLAGNKLYAAGDVAGAADSYTLALGNALDDLLTVKVRLNRAQCFLRSEKYSEAVADCTHVINTINSNNNLGVEMLQFRMKSLMRRAQAQEGLGNYQKALLDVESVLSSDPPAAICKAAVIFRSKLKSFVLADHEVSLSEGRPNMMVTSQQALRLGFIQQPPVTFTLGSSELVRLCITNELGLWDRALLLHGGDGGAMPRVLCRLKAISSSTASRLCTNENIVALRLSPACSDNVNMYIGEDGKVRECAVDYLVHSYLISRLFFSWMSS
jgi:tetratricopeptide (TPR) repeat protein